MEIRKEYLQKPIVFSFRAISRWAGRSIWLSVFIGIIFALVDPVGKLGADTIIKPGKRLHFEKIDTRHRLPSNDIRSVVQDSIGFMWFLTSKNALCRYDGNEVVTYSPLDAFADSGATRFIRQIYVDAKGTLWLIGSSAEPECYSSIFRFNLETGGFDQIIATGDSLPNIFNISDDNSGNLYFCTYDRQHRHHDFCMASPVNDSYLIKKLAALTFGDGSTLPSSLLIKKIIKTNDGNLLLAIDGYGVVEYNLTSGRIDADQYQALNSDFHRFGFQISDILIDSRQNLWLAAQKFLVRYSITNGALQYHLLPRHSDGKEVEIDKELKDFAWQPDTDDDTDDPQLQVISKSDFFNINCLCEGKGGQIWIVGGPRDQEETFFKYDPATEIFWQYKTDPFEENQIPINNINCFYIDRSGSAWIATAQSGVFRFSPERPFINVRALSDSINFNDGGLTEIFEDHQNNLWFAISNKVVRYNPDTKNIKIYPLNVEANSIAVIHIYEDTRNTIWLATTRNLYKLNPTADKFNRTKLQTSYRYNKYTFDKADVVFAIHEDRKGNFWLGTAAGLCLYNRKTNQSQYFPIAINSPEYRNMNVVYDILEDRNDNLWLATRRGLVLFDRNTRAYHLYRDSTLAQGSACNAITFGLYESQDGQIWLSSYFPGIISFNPVTKEFKYRIDKTGYIWKYPVTAVIEDHNQIFWFRTNEGIIKHDPQLNTYTLFDRDDNVRYYYRESYQSGPKTAVCGITNRSNNYCRLRSGWILIGGSYGYTCFHPDSITSDHTPQMVITKFQSDYQHKILHPNPTQPIKFVLPWHENNFTINFSLLDYYLPHEIKYHYILEGFDNDWKRCVQANSASYTNVPPGQYIFRIRGENSDGVFSRNEPTLSIRIVPPLWQGLWFKGFLFIFALAIIILINYIRMTVIRSQKAELEKQVAERTQALESAHNLLDEKVHARTRQLAATNEALMHEINIRQVAEESLRHSEETARVLINATEDMAMLIDPQTKILAANNSLLASMKVTPEAVINHSIREFLTPEVAKFREQFFSKCITTRLPQEFEDENDGQIYHHNMYPVIGKKGEVINIAIYIRDITDRKKIEKFLNNTRFELEKQVIQRTAELRMINRRLINEIAIRKNVVTKLRTSEEKYRDLFQNANDLIWLMDKSGKFVSINKHFKVLSGYLKKELLAINPLILISPEFRFRIMRCYLKVLKDSPVDIEINIITKAGEIRPIWLKMRPIIKNDQIIGIHGIGRDITEIRRAQQELRESEEQKRESLRQFTLKLAHEVKNPLASIKSSAQLVASTNIDYNPQVEKHMDIISRNVDTCNKVIRDLFSYTHTDNYHFEEVDSVKFIKSLEDFIEVKLNEYPHLQSAVKYKRDLPAIYIDEFRLSQAFQNIINNAFESMTNKGRLTVAVKEIKNEKQIQFLFTDTGSGIPAEDLPLIFQSFYSSKSKGFGLGLALAKEIIKFHHGKISVTSVVRHGTTFKVVIPTLS